MSIKRFIFVVTTLLAITFYTFFAVYHNTHAEQTTEMLIENVHSLISENAYAISNGLTTINDIESFRSRLNRTVNYSEIIDTIIVTQGNKIILVTDPGVNSIPNSTQLINYKSLKDMDHNSVVAYSVDIDYYENDVQIPVTIYGTINHRYIQEQITKQHLILFIFIGLPPMVMIIGFWILVYHQIDKPLQYLKKYAFSNRDIPQKFKVKELEAVRSSLTETFERLDNEKNELFKMSTTDDLCGLANRNALTERLNWLISDADRSKSEFALLFVDLDHFKDVNDSLGHDAGDELLKQIANALRKILRDSDIIARLGGDEFVIILNHDHETDVIHAITRIIDRVSLPWIVFDQHVNITCSIGIVIYPKDGDNVTTLMKNADIAMYEAKKRGRNNYYFFTEELNQRVQEEIAIEREMKQSLFKDEFELYYQPKIDVHTREIVGCEALVRWLHPGKGLIPPDKFIPVAERNGFILELGDWIIDEAVKQQKEWCNRGFGSFKVSINISTSQLSSKDFISTIVNTIKKYDADPTCIDLEITEHSLMKSNTYSVNISIIKYLRSLGISFSLDDFGTGYSSLSYLKTLPLDTIKIDKSFMDDYNEGQGGVIIESVINLAKALKYNVVAEGIEDKDQLEFLRDLKCDLYQGYYAAKPLNVKQFECFIESQEDHDDFVNPVFVTTECELCKKHKLENNQIIIERM